MAPAPASVTALIDEFAHAFNHTIGAERTVTESWVDGGNDLMVKTAAFITFNVVRQKRLSLRAVEHAVSSVEYLAVELVEHHFKPLAKDFDRAAGAAYTTWEAAIQPTRGD